MRSNDVKSNTKKWLSYILLVLAVAIYACTGAFTRFASMYPFLSWQYILCVIGAIGVIGIYAIIWQQLIQRMDISLAYMFKGLGVVFALLICHYVLGEIITLKNIVGAVIIIAGITLFAWSDRKEVAQ